MTFMRQRSRQSLKFAHAAHEGTVKIQILFKMRWPGGMCYSRIAPALNKADMPFICDEIKCHQ